MGGQESHRLLPKKTSEAWRVAWYNIGRMHRARLITYATLLFHLSLYGSDDLAWQTSLGKHLANSKFAQAQWGIMIRRAADGIVIFATNEHRALKPASNAKLLTTAYALQTLGPESRIATPVFLEGAMASPGEWRGNLVLRGMADPSWESRAMTPDVDAFGKITSLLTNEGIHKISGDIILETGAISGGRWGAHWAESDRPRAYGAEIGPINLLDNASEVVITANVSGGTAKIRFSPEVSYLSATGRVQTVISTNREARVQLDRLEDERAVRAGGSLTTGLSNWVGLIAVPKPADWALLILKDRLRRDGIEISGQVRTRPILATPSQADTRPLGAVESPVLKELLRTTLKESQNLYAECLFRQAGEAQREAIAKSVSSETLARAGLTHFLMSMGASTNEFLVDDGSGLSRGGRCSAAVLVTVIDLLTKGGQASWLREALPIAGVDGTLRQRFTRAPLKGNLRAKTGTLRGVASLSGLVRAQSGENLIFSVLLNDDSPNSTMNVRQEVDVFVELMAKYPGNAAKTATP